jgi:hypothetical protein
MKNGSNRSTVDRRVVRFDAVEGLRQALDFSYRRMRELARRNWERHFAGTFDPSDSCVTVRCSGFLRKSKGQALPRFGH